MYFLAGMLTAGTSPITPRLNLSNPGSQLPTFPSLQLKGCEVLARLLGEIPPDEDIPPVQFSIGKAKTSRLTTKLENVEKLKNSKAVIVMPRKVQFP